MSHIRSLKPNVTRDEAVEMFSSGGLIDAASRWLRGPLRSVADVYIPFRLFEITLSEGGRENVQCLAVDAITGGLDLYHFDQIPAESDVVILETRNCIPAALDDVQLTPMVVTKSQRIVFNQGFFRLRSPKFTATPLAGEIHIPYWVGFRGHNDHLRFDVIDAVRRRHEGARVRRLLYEWLSSAS